MILIAMNTTKREELVYLIDVTKYSLPPLTRHRKGNENPVELAGVELAGE